MVQVNFQTLYECTYEYLYYKLKWFIWMAFIVIIASGYWMLIEWNIYIYQSVHNQLLNMCKTWNNSSTEREKERQWKRKKMSMLSMSIILDSVASSNSSFHGKFISLKQFICNAFGPMRLCLLREESLLVNGIHYWIGHSLPFLIYNRRYSTTGQMQQSQ